MPRPGDLDKGIGADPFSAVLANNAAELAALHGETAPQAPVAAPPAAPGMGFPPGLAPQSADVALQGLPPHLAGAASPDSRVLTDEQAAAMGLVATPTGEPQAQDVEAILAASQQPEVALSAPWEKDDKDTKDKAAQGKKKKCDCGKENQADALKCASCGKALVGRKARDKANLSVEPEEHQAVIYNVQGMNLSVEQDDLLWKVVCKTGTLALSPGPGQIDLERPLEITADLFDDMVLSAEESAFPYITVPETHANGALENTGYVRRWEVLERDTLLADTRLPEKHRELIEGDDEDTRYLLAGIEFTEPDVKEKAERGSIPDTSIGVKFNYRNKRTGKLYKAAWEHVALTPMPWIDGLVPFGLSQQGKPFDAEALDVPYDGVYMPTDMELSTEVRQRGAFDAESAKAQIAAMKPGDEWSWDYDVRVQAITYATPEDEPGTVYLLNGGYIEGPDYTPPQPKIFQDIDGLVGTVATRVAECITRRAAERAKYAHHHYGQAQTGEGLELAVIHFDPKMHPRDWKGRFVEKIDGLEKGEAVELPGGASVRKDFNGDLNVEGPDGKTKLVNDAEGAAEEAIDVDPETIHPDEVADYIEDPSRLTPEGQALAKKHLGDEDPHSGGAADVATLAADHKHLVQSGASQKAITAKWEQLVAARKKAGMKTKGGAANLSIQPVEDGTTVSDEDLLALVEDDELPAALQASQTQETLNTMPTAEELLASQQADLEASQQRIADLEARLESQGQTLLSQSTDLHTKRVNEKVAALQKAQVPPALCLAAREIYLGDSPAARAAAAAEEEGGLNLSVQVPKKDEAGSFEERKLQTPSDIVDHLLASVPRGENAAGLAGMLDNLAELNASAHSETNPEDEARQAVEALERQRHPERFDEDGKRK